MESGAGRLPGLDECSCLFVTVCFLTVLCRVMMVIILNEVKHELFKRKNRSLSAEQSNCQV